MKLMIMNSSGNAGKSLMARELFYPRMDDPIIIEIETVNSGGINFEGLNVEKYRGDADFSDIYMKLVDREDAIIDVGASNLSRFWENMSSFAGIETIFDFFVVPTSTRGKIQEDTFKTINFLRSEGIPDEKIKVVFNEVVTSVNKDFEVLLSADFPFDDELYIQKNESLFNDLGFLKKTIYDIYDPDLDYYKPLFLKEQDGAEKLRLVKMDLCNRQAHRVKERMDTVFSILTGRSPKEWKKESVNKGKRASTKKTKEESPEISENDEEL